MRFIDFHRILYTVIDKKQVMAKYLGDDIYAVINRPYFDVATVKFKNPIITEGNSKQLENWIE